MFRPYSKQEQLGSKKLSIPKSKPYKPTGDKKFFEMLWLKRKQPYCSNCKEPIHEPEVSNFSHIRDKKNYPELRFVEENIIIACKTCHTIWDQGLHEDFYKRKDLYKKKWPPFKSCNASQPY